MVLQYKRPYIVDYIALCVCAGKREPQYKGITHYSSIADFKPAVEYIQEGGGLSFNNDGNF